MTPIAATLALTGALVALLAGIGLLRFRTPYARFHAAGKASPVAFLLTALGAAWSLGWDGAAYLVIAAIAMVLTLPVGVHLLFRAVHRTAPGDHFAIDELADAEAAARPSRR